MPILQAGYLVLPTQDFGLESSLELYREPHPSYRPTASWTKSSTSSGSKVGRRAVVRSKGWRNIQYHGLSQSDAFCLTLLCPLTAFHDSEILSHLSPHTEPAIRLTSFGIDPFRQLYSGLGSLSFVLSPLLHLNFTSA